MHTIDTMKWHFKQEVFTPLIPSGTADTSYAIAGGAIRAFLAGEPIRDIDIFCDSKAAEDQLLTFLREYGTIINENDTLGNFTFNKHWLQVIKGRHHDLSTPSLIQSFDFTICGAMLRADGQAHFLPTFFQDCLAKHLRIQSLPYPLATLERLQKYIKRGYTACNGTLIEIARGIQNINLNDTNPLNSLSFYPDGTPRIRRFD